MSKNVHVWTDLRLVELCECVNECQRKGKRKISGYDEFVRRHPEQAYSTTSVYGVLYSKLKTGKLIFEEEVNVKGKKVDIYYVIIAGGIKISTVKDYELLTELKSDADENEEDSAKETNKESQSTPTTEKLLREKSAGTIKENEITGKKKRRRRKTDVGDDGAISAAKALRASRLKKTGGDTSHEDDIDAPVTEVKKRKGRPPKITVEPDEPILELGSFELGGEIRSGRDPRELASKGIDLSGCRTNRC